MSNVTEDIGLCDIKRVPIINEIPDYDNIELVKKITASCRTHFRYAIDGNLYLYDEERRCISRVVDVNGANPVFEPNIAVDDSHPSASFPMKNQNFIASWVTSDYCYDGISATISCNEVKYYCASSASAKSCRWNFGDGSQSSDTSPAHIYSVPGNYNVSVYVIFDDGSSKSYTKKVTIPPPPELPRITKE